LDDAEEEGGPPPLRPQQEAERQDRPDKRKNREPGGRIPRLEAFPGVVLDDDLMRPRRHGRSGRVLDPVAFGVFVMPATGLRERQTYQKQKGTDDLQGPVAHRGSLRHGALTKIWRGAG